MSTDPVVIPLFNLLLVLIPVVVVLLVLLRWSLHSANALYSVARMGLQLALIGFLLDSIFDGSSHWLVLLVLTVMVVAAAWIALGTVKQQRKKLFSRAFLSILLCGGSVLWWVVIVVLEEPSLWAPKVAIPLAGMIFAGAMNSISLAVERLQAELASGAKPESARNTAMRTAMIPVINSMFAVGLVSLPGMMTGQILSGVSPLIAVRYQVVVMCMLFGTSGLATALFLKLALPFMSVLKQHETNQRESK
ncbi:MAG: ABC transporter permease [Immundisolibacteraceae bacterium]|nr:ABC transporter permease [Immundisolibacteraceae bacterium]